MAKIADILDKQDNQILSEWMQEMSVSVRREDLIKDRDLRHQCADFLGALRSALHHADGLELSAPPWQPVRDILADISRNRAQLGFSPSQTALFIFSLKKPLFEALRRELSGDGLAEQTMQVSDLLDKLGLFTTEVYQKSREEVINRQQQDMLELSTPVVKLWEGVLALPLIGTLDSARTQVVMEALLQRIVETGSEVAIIDITGVPTVDTLVAQHLLKTVTAARLMGADCIISGIRPQIAQTIVHLGVSLGDVTTKGTLADAFQLSLHRAGYHIVKK